MSNACNISRDDARPRWVDHRLREENLQALREMRSTELEAALHSCVWNLECAAHTYEDDAHATQQLGNEIISLKEKCNNLTCEKTKTHETLVNSYKENARLLRENTSLLEQQSSLRHTIEMQRCEMRQLNEETQSLIDQQASHMIQPVQKQIQDCSQDREEGLVCLLKYQRHVNGIYKATEAHTKLLHHRIQALESELTEKCLVLNELRMRLKGTSHKRSGCSCCHEKRMKQRSLSPMHQQLLPCKDFEPFSKPRPVIQCERFQPSSSCNDVNAQIAAQVVSPRQVSYRAPRSRAPQLSYDAHSPRSSSKSQCEIPHSKLQIYKSLISNAPYNPSLSPQNGAPCFDTRLLPSKSSHKLASAKHYAGRHSKKKNHVQHDHWCDAICSNPNDHDQSCPPISHHCNNTPLHFEREAASSSSCQVHEPFTTPSSVQASEQMHKDVQSVKRRHVKNKLAWMQHQSGKEGSQMQQTTETGDIEIHQPVILDDGMCKIPSYNTRAPSKGFSDESRKWMQMERTVCCENIIEPSKEREQRCSNGIIILVKSSNPCHSSVESSMIEFKQQSNNTLHGEENQMSYQGASQCDNVILSIDQSEESQCVPLPLKGILINRNEAEPSLETDSRTTNGKTSTMFENDVKIIDNYGTEKGEDCASTSHESRAPDLIKYTYTTSGIGANDTLSCNKAEGRHGVLCKVFTLPNMPKVETSLLAKIALNGVETALKEWQVSMATGLPDKRGHLSIKECQRDLSKKNSSRNFQNKSNVVDAQTVQPKKLRFNLDYIGNKCHEGSHDLVVQPSLKIPERYLGIRPEDLALRLNKIKFDDIFKTNDLLKNLKFCCWNQPYEWQCAGHKLYIEVAPCSYILNCMCQSQHMDDSSKIFSFWFFCM